MKLSDGERLTILMLCDLFRHFKVDSEIDEDFVKEAIYRDCLWAIPFAHSGALFERANEHPVLREVIDILDMWGFIEDGVSGLRPDDVAELAKFGSVKFMGFDGNKEADHLNVSSFLTERVDKFPSFKGRCIDTHYPTLSRARAMLANFDPLRATLVDRKLAAAELLRIFTWKRLP